MKRNKVIKVLVIIGVSLLSIILIVFGGLYWMFRTELKAIGSIETLEDGLFSLTYSGDYGFSGFLEQGGASSDEIMAGYISGFLSKGFYQYKPSSEAYGCSTISARAADGGYVFGRNFDWQKCLAMIVRAEPEDGYASISTVNLDFLGFGEGFGPDAGMANKFLSLAAVYAPLDGMNEKGLCIADLMIDDAGVINQNTDKPDLTTTSAIRMILDYAATVDEAIALLEQYDMHSSASLMHHLAISDATGRSVVVEYVDNVMQVTETQIVTNFFLTEGELYQHGSDESKARYAELARLYDDHSGVMERSDVKTALAAVRQGMMGDEGWNTEWSIVYDQMALQIDFYRSENYDKGYSFSLSD